MKLYLVHHGDAVPKQIDPTRPLTPQGRRDLERLGRFLEGAGVRVGRVIHSTKPRARDTAAILLPHLAPGAPLEERAGICPDDPIEPLLADLPGWGEDTLVAGHGPFFGRLIPHLLAGPQAPPFIATVPGSAFCLERTTGEGSYRLAWMVRPHLLPPP